MSEPTYELETTYEIWHNRQGSHLEIGNDRDGLGLIEIRSYSGVGDEKQPEARITITYEQLPLVIEALNRLRDS